MFQGSLVPVLGVSIIMLAVVDGCEIIGGRSKTRIDGKCLLVSLARFIQGVKMVVRHADVVPNDGGFQIALPIGDNGCRVLSTGHQDVGLLFDRDLLETNRPAFLHRRLLYRVICSLSGSYLTCGYTN